jgi:hypothetical protein
MLSKETKKDKIKQTLCPRRVGSILFESFNQQFSLHALFLSGVSRMRFIIQDDGVCPSAFRAR